MTVNKLLPISSYIELYYECPNCASHIPASKNEVMCESFSFECCDTMYSVQRLQNVNVNYEPYTIALSEGIIKEAISTIVSSGYTRDEAISLVDKVKDKNSSTDSVSELVRLALAEVESK